MSRLARKPIQLGKAEVTVSGGTLTVKGPKATLIRQLHPAVTITVDGKEATVAPRDRSREARALTGTFVAHLKNMVQGVETPYVKKLILEGVGYRFELKGRQLSMQVGFSHPVVLDIPEGITASLEKNVLALESSNKDALGQFAANVRRVKEPEPYLGKGIRYEDEVVRRKQGKKAV